jgi:hypothetical protein
MDRNLPSLPLFVVFVLAFIVCTGCAQPATPAAAVLKEAPMTVNLTSPAFAEGGSIPVRYTCEGENVSPPLNWTPPPSGTASLALIADDPDAPSGTWVHWVLYNLPGDADGQSEGVKAAPTLANGAAQGNNSSNTLGYRGPCPPPGSAHRYFFKLYALDAKLDLAAGATKAGLLKAMNGHILAEGQLMGTYQRK